MGPRLCLLHGFGGSGRSFDALVREPATSALGAKVFAPDVVGHGAAWPLGPSARPSSFEDEVDRLAAAAHEALGGPFVLLGYSLGARLGLGLALRHPALVSGLVLVSGSPGLEDDAARAKRAVDDEAWALRAERESLDALFDAWEAQPLFASERGLAPAVLDERRALRRAQDGAGLAHALRVLSPARMPSYWPRLGELRAPRFVAGALDGRYVATLERATRASPGASLVVVPEVGHNVLLEAPAALAAVTADAVRAAAT